MIVECCAGVDTQGGVGFAGEADTLQRLDRIDAYDMSFLYDRWIEKSYGLIGSDNCEIAARELKRFFALSLIYPKAMLFPPTRIDACWHEFILYTSQYQQFCADIFGQYFDHNPRPALDPQQKEPRSTIELYNEAFGPAPAFMWDPVTKAEQRWLLYQHTFSDLPKRSNNILLIGLVAALMVAIMPLRHERKDR
jgi:hypothetical protein